MFCQVKAAEVDATNRRNGRPWSVMKGQRAKRDRVHDAERGRVGPDAERERQDCDRGPPGCRAQYTHGEV